MKQWITFKQLQELRPEQREELREWWKPENGDMVYAEEPSRDGSPRKPFPIMVVDNHDIATDEEVDGVNNLRDMDELFEDLRRHVLPAMSIGQCIDFLASEDATTLADIFSKYTQRVDIWAWSPYEFIDVLWQAVKEVL